MTLTNLCSLFDQYEIVDTEISLDREYYASSEIIYSDGHIESNINSEGYIHITKVIDANYIMFLDQNEACFLCIYKYTPETKYKDVIDSMNKMKRLSAKISKEDDDIEQDIKSANNIIMDDLVDINEFTCTECKSKDKMKFTRSKKDSDILTCKCQHCSTEYSFAPSKYYRLASKKVVFFKSDKSSRQIYIDTKLNQVTVVAKKKT
jgi:hypothetical protein